MGLERMLIQIGMIAPEVIQSQFEWSLGTIGSILALLTAGSSVWWTMKKNKKEALDGTRNYQKEMIENMTGDIKNLRKGSEKYALLRKVIIDTPGVDHIAILKEMEDEYKIINPE